MSLLMDALKQAEHAKREKPQAAERNAAAQKTVPVEDNIALDSAAATNAMSPEPEPVHTDMGLSLSPVEQPLHEPESPGAFSLSPEPARPATTETDSAPDPAVESQHAVTMLLPVENPDAAEGKADPVQPQAQGQDIAAKTTITTPAEPVAEESTPGEYKTIADATPLTPAAARVFAASKARQQAQRRRSLLGLIGLVLLMLVALIAYYYWASLQQTLPPPMPMAPTPTDITNTDAGDSPEALAWEPTPVELTLSKPVRSPLFDAQNREQAADAELSTRPTEKLIDHDVAAPQTAATSLIRFHRSSRANSLQETLAGAYQAYLSGQLLTAMEKYEQVLRQEANNRDALLGLAAVAIRQQNSARARQYYRDVLQRDPGDNSALAGLLSLQQESDPQTETDLKTLLQRQPQTAHLHFALANLYAAEQRWPLAQQAYFEAQRIAPENPDYAYNLAVSLEHLEKPELALRYYRRALEQHQQQPGRLDSRIVQQRIEALSARVAP